MRSDGRSRALREIKDRVVSLPNHSGFRVLWGFGGVGHFDKLSDRWGNCRGPRWLSDRMVSLPNHLGGRFGRVWRFDGLSDQWAQRLGGELVEPSGWVVRWGRALRLAQGTTGDRGRLGAMVGSRDVGRVSDRVGLGIDKTGQIFP